MRKIQGFTLVELVIFIVVMSIFAASSMGAFMTILSKNTDLGQNLAAAQLANARMNLVLMNRRVNGVASMVDPCVSSPPAACTALASFASSKGYSVSSSLPAISGGERTATITVTGTGYATNVERFVQ